MSQIVTAETMAAKFAARFPAAHSGVVGSLSASAGTVPSLEAGAVRNFASVSGKLQWVKATEHFYQAGELILAGDYVQVEEDDAKRLVNANRAAFATDDEVKTAQAAPKAKA